MENTTNTTEWTLPGGVILRRAASDTDLDAFVELHEEAARWLWDQGIHQWEPGAFQKEWLAEPVQRGEVYLAWQGGVPAGSIILQWADEYTWGPRPDDAGYVHGLRVRRSAAGQGIGRALLRWAEAYAAQSGKTYLRLDCTPDNPRLIDYYLSAGFTRAEDIEIEPGWTPARFERRIAWNIATPHGALIVTLAQPEDVDAILAIWEGADEWMRMRGIEPGAPPLPMRDIVAQRIARGESYVARYGGPIGESIGTIVLEWADDGVWADLGAVDDACYVHGLATSRAYAGQGIGAALLGWAEEVAQAAGKRYLRLDCDADNPALRAYYERTGLTPCGDIVMPTHHAARFEKQVANA
jgi:ribosomal protein S18 acetylase RimI-like enzyme